MKKLFQKVKTYTRNDGVVVTEYEPLTDIYIDSINLETGKVELKKILKATKHENLRMFRITDIKGRFKTFWCSDDHSLIVYDEELDMLRKISPEEIKKNPERYYLLKQV